MPSGAISPLKVPVDHNKTDDYGLTIGSLVSERLEIPDELDNY